MVCRFPLAAVGLLCFAALAGCASSGDPSDSSSSIPTEIQDVTVDADKGLIRGVVVSDAIVPIANATVKVLSLNLEQKTTVNGAFLFKDLKPGNYFVQASKLGYKAIQVQAEVKAGDADPPTLRIALPTDKASLPYARLTSWTGFLECGAGTQAGSINPCAVDEANSHNTQEVAMDDGVPTWAQIEMTWDNTQAVSTELQVGIYDPATIASDFTGAVGPSPVILKVNGTLIADTLGSDAKSMIQRVFPGGSDASPLTVFTNQKFTVYTTQFHGFEPREGWSFYANGECNTIEQCGKK